MFWGPTTGKHPAGDGGVLAETTANKRGGEDMLNGVKIFVLRRHLKL